MKDDLDKMFDNLKGSFDTEEPTIGHFHRFEQKLSKQSSSKKNNRHWVPLLSIAAMIMIMLGIWIGMEYKKSSIGLELATVSPKMHETQDYFTTVIKREMEIIGGQRSPETNKMINDSFIQLTSLESHYNHLKLELGESSQDQRIIFAMVRNFQLRIEVLENLLLQLEQQQKFKNNSHEISI
ncbi:MAG: hypothetical protein COB98_07460 [Flavobacteriaceae bacterium]|nr:MAG: hypothetical protein COB98_07460 [Flavobacteriaceae bacterium]